MTSENSLAQESSESPEQAATHVAHVAERDLLASLPEELQQEAEVVLEHEKVYQPESIASKTAKLQHWQRAAWVRWTVSAVLLMVAIAFAGPQWQKLLGSENFGNTLRRGHFSMLIHGEPSAEQLRLKENPQTPYTRRERLLQAQDWKGLHELEPESPVWHQNAMFVDSDGEALLSGWRESWAELDPDNSLLPIFAAMTEKVKDSNDWEDIYTREVDRETDEVTYTIHDEETFFVIRDQLLEALELPRFEVYPVSEQILAASFPEGKTSLDHPSQAKFKVLYSLFSRTAYTARTQLQCANFLATEANRAAGVGDREAFERVLKVSQHWCEEHLRNKPDNIIDCLVSRTVLSTLAEELAQSGEVLGLNKEVSQMANFSKAYQKRSDFLNNRKDIEFPREKMSILSLISQPATNVIVEKRFSFDYAPLVREERAWGFSAGLFLSFLLLLIFILPLHWVARAAHGSVRTQLSSRLLGLTSWQAWLILLLIAWALPLGLLWGLRVWEASSNLDYSLIHGFGLGSDFGHPLVVIALSMVLVRIWARRLFPAAKQEGNRGWMRFDYCALLLFLLCFAGLQLVPLMYEMPNLSEFMLEGEWSAFLVYGLIGLFLLLVLAQTLVVLLIPALKRRKAPLWMMLSSHASVPIFALWALSFVCLSHFQQQEAGYWALEDETIFSVKDLTITETEIAQQAMNEIRALWVDVEKAAGEGATPSSSSE